MPRKPARKPHGRAEPVQAGRPVGWLSFHALAALAGISQPAVTKARKSGRLKDSIREDSRGPYVADPALALRELRENASRPRNGGKPTSIRVACGPSLVDAQREVAVRRAQQLELSNRKQEGTLIDRATEERRDRQVAMTIRDAILAVPDRVSSELAAETSRERVYARLEEELRVALGALADLFEEQAEEEAREDSDLRAAGEHHAS